jgi:hypothetical protein
MMSTGCGPRCSGRKFSGSRSAHRKQLPLFFEDDDENDYEDESLNAGEGTRTRAARLRQ